MSAICGVCNLQCKNNESEVKCSGDSCDLVFHLDCIKDDLKGKKTRAQKEYKCKNCRIQRPNQEMSVSTHEPLTKEFLLKVMDDYGLQLKAQLETFRKDMGELSTSVQFVSDKLDVSNNLMSDMKKQFADIKKDLESEKAKNSLLSLEVQSLKERVRSLEQYTRKNNIEISGIPSTPNENVMEIVKDLGSSLGLEVDESQINAAHRIPSYNKERSPALIVQFQKKCQKDLILTKYKEARTLTAKQVNPMFPEQRVYIGDHMSPENKQFLAKLKQKCNEIGYTYAWFKEGKFFARKNPGDKCNRINSINDIDKLK